MIGPEELAAGARFEASGDYLAAAAAYRAVTEQGDETDAAEGWFRLGRVSWRHGRHDAALAAFQSARALAERTGDVELLARVENGTGAVHYARGDHTSARRAYAAAGALTRDDSMRGRVVLNLGVLASAEGDLAAAREHYERARGLFLQGGDVGGAALALLNRGIAEAANSDWALADSSLCAALALAMDGADREAVAKILVNRSQVLVERGALEEAVAHCDRAMAIYAEVGDDVGRGEALRWRAHALGRAGSPRLAERDAAEALQIAVRAGARRLEAESARDLGVLRGMLRDRASSHKLLRRALELFTELGARGDAAEVGAMLQRPTPARSLPRIDLDEAPEG